MLASHLSHSTNVPHALPLVAALVALSALAGCARSTTQPENTVASAHTATSASTDAPASHAPATITAAPGGSTTLASRTGSSATPAKPLHRTVADDPNFQPQLEGDYAKQRASVAAGTAAGDLRALSINARPVPFDPAGDTRAYIDSISPSRIWDVSAPGKNVPELTALTPILIQLPSQGSTELAVKTKPLSPVIWSSYDLGVLPNGLTSQTVHADSDGVASIRWTATPGTVALTRIQAGSPGASGSVTFSTETVTVADWKPIGTQPGEVVNAEPPNTPRLSSAPAAPAPAPR